MHFQNITWQSRPTTRGPSAVRHGIESEWSDSTAQLLRAAKSATLLTRLGYPVIVNELTRVRGEVWSGSVVQVGAGAEHIRLGTVVEFQETDVQAATLT